MIVSRIQGGLGNQMFQYAYGLYLARRYETPLWLECSHVARDRLRSMMLDQWKIDTPHVTEHLRQLVPHRYGGAGWKNWLRGQKSMRRVAERPYGFQKKFLDPGDHVFLDGYWQSERFFPQLRTTLQQCFQPADDVSPTTRAIANKMAQGSSVSLHVRRGDYVTSEHTNSVHGICSQEYYQSCIDQLQGSTESMHVFVFSDDPRWCQQNLVLGCPVTYVTHNGAQRAHEDIWLMTQCRHHVVANSSFSWWGAWLRTDDTGMVFAPQPWFRSEQLDTSSVVPAAWRRVANRGTTHSKAA